MKKTLLEHVTEFNERLSNEVTEEDRNQYLAKVGSIIMECATSSKQDVIEVVDYIDHELLNSDTLEPVVKDAILLTRALRRVKVGD